ncbi:MAG: sigma-70 family RNA polymerase sigma factor, partial [Chloroflexi bacterium]|nr:sigma-70 family RNA polymerase sigma factor [Chloroflexota bacterium]
EVVERRLVKEEVAQALQCLEPRERRVVVLRFGLEDGRPRTLAEIGEELGVSRERVRQIEAQSLRTLRRPDGGFRHLRTYVT